MIIILMGIKILDKLFKVGAKKKMKIIPISLNSLNIKNKREFKNNNYKKRKNLNKCKKEKKNILK